MNPNSLTNGSNVYAPAAYNGLISAAPSGFVDVDFTYVYDVVMTASQFLRDQQVAIMPDADFIWRAWVTATATGQFSIRFSDSQGFYFSNGLLLNNNLGNGLVSAPTPVIPEQIFPRGGRIGIDIQDQSAATNTIQILFRGVKRFRIGA